MKIDFKYLDGPHGDEMSSYQVLTDKECTIEEFINNFTNPKVNPYGGKFGRVYLNGMLLVNYGGKENDFWAKNKDFYQTYKYRRAKEIRASGGWGTVDYFIYCY